MISACFTFLHVGFHSGVFAPHPWSRSACPWMPIGDSRLPQLAWLAVKSPSDQNHPVLHSLHDGRNSQPVVSRLLFSRARLRLSQECFQETEAELPSSSAVATRRYKQGNDNQTG